MLNKSIPLQEFNNNAKGSLSAHLGIEITEIGDDYVCGKMPVDKRTCQPFGILHGGASVSLAETLGSIAGTLAIDLNHQRCVGLEINANHLRQVKEGYVYGKAKAIHLGKTTQVWEIRITNEQDQLVCISRFTAAVIQMGK